MRFPDLETLTAEQVALNEAATGTMIPGNHYRFEPPVRTTAIPVGSRNGQGLAECEFSQGWYLGFKHGNHVFQGKPVNDQRPLPANQRESYFHVLFVGGVKVILDKNPTNK